MSTKINKSSLPLDRFLQGEEDVRQAIIVIDDEETLWEYRDLTWKGKTECVSKATTFQVSESGDTVLGFDVSVYYLECLKRMLVSGPFPITPTTLAMMRVDIGEKLQALVPAPMGVPDVADAAKKESTISSEEQSPEQAMP